MAWDFIENSVLLLEEFDEPPSFHDAYINMLNLNSGNLNSGGKTAPSVTIVFDFPCYIGSEQEYQISHYSEVTIEFLGVSSIDISDFTYDNCLYYLDVKKDEVSGLLSVVMSSSTNVESFECNMICTSIVVQKCLRNTNT
ncbi:hypothetical protein [Vibrio sinaloensis]|uniref:hypothetical protein n=1 Tax=Photobacterium sp. (strain ATCC 43367) TaxID=379097 RepID=UPI0035E83D23